MSDRTRTVRARLAAYGLLAAMFASPVVWSVAAAAPPAGVVTVLSGTLAVRSGDEPSHDVRNTQPLQSGDTVLTGSHSLAVVGFQNVGHARLGPISTASVFAFPNGSLLRLSDGAACATADAVGLTLATDRVSASATGAAIYTLRRRGDEVEVAVYAGSVVVRDAGGRSKTYAAGSALSGRQTDPLTPTRLSSVQPHLVELRCPSDEVVRAALGAAPTPAPQAPAVENAPGGGGGGVIGLLLGLLAVGALALHGGGGGSGSASNPAPPAPNPTPTPPGPAITPSISPLPSTLPSVPSPSLSPTPTPVATATPTAAPTATRKH